MKSLLMFHHLCRRRVDAMLSTKRWRYSTLDKLSDLAVDAHTADLSKADKTSSSIQRKRKKITAKVQQSVQNFYSHYQEAYGKERWEKLCKALMEPSRTAALMNQFVYNDTQFEDSIWKGNRNEISVDRVPWSENLVACWLNHGETRLLPPTPVNARQQDQSNNYGEIDHSLRLMNYYCLDPSSLLPVLALGLSTTYDKKPRQKPLSVLDMCAAPGGKALAILQTMASRRVASGNEMVVLNEYSDARRRRLRKVLDQYVPMDLMNSSVFVTGRDGITFGNLRGDITYGVKHQPFSHILCDVPCSGERHLVQNGGEIGEWRPGISRKNQKRQLALLKAAISGCQPGGTIVYSTCSISPGENDGIVQKLLSKRKSLVDVKPKLSFEIGEPTTNGWIVLPDHPSCTGMGPMYIAVLRRING